MKLLSIIIPVYNTASYLATCINSCLKQDIENDKYEIIIINDGSTDNSEQIITSFCKKNKNIFLYNRSNQGVSSARNFGLNKATGKYIIFVDSDDQITPNTLNQITTTIERRKNDFMILNSIINNKDIVYPFPTHLRNKTLSGIELYKQNYTRGSVCGVIFLKYFLTTYNIDFSEEMTNGEDSFFMALSFIYGQSISYLDVNLYNIRIREGSASRVWDFEKITRLLNNIQIINKYITNNQLSTDQQSILESKAYTFVYNALYKTIEFNHLRHYPEIRKQILHYINFSIDINKAYTLIKEKRLLNFSIDLYFLWIFLRQKLDKIRTLQHGYTTSR